MRLKGVPIRGPGADRVFVFQEFDQLLPWKTVKQNVMFALQASGKMRGKAAEAQAMRYIDKVNLTKFADSYPHTLSGGMKQRVAIARAHGHGARHPADGRAVRRARCADPAQDAGGAAAAVGRHALHGAVRHPLDPRGRADRQPHPAAVAAPGPGQGRAQQRRHAIRSIRHADASCRTASTTSCSRTASRNRRPCPMAELRAPAARFPAPVPPTRPEYLRDVVAGGDFGVVEKPLTIFQRLANQGWLRKAFILVVIAAGLGALRAAAQQSAAGADLLGHASRRSGRGIVSGDIPQKVSNSVQLLLKGYAIGLVLAMALDGARHDVAHRQRPAGDADLGLQPAARHRAAAAGADLVRPGRRLHHVRAGALGAVGGGAQHAFGLPVGVEHAAHGGAQLRPAAASPSSPRS